ncbi:MAG: penicillin amidase [Symbiobacteriaceae bacterium]|nr:penicillin amidase [Symbiobacteriaceae bacterium]
MGISLKERHKVVPAPARKKRLRWLRWVAYSVVVLILVAAGGVYAGARRSLPQVTGTLKLAGLRAPVTVYRDEWGVPHIEAANSLDLYMAQGYVTAQDRLWQMDVTRRAAAGRLSEAMGASQINTDKFLRTLMLRQAAERTIDSLSPWAIEALEAYAAGVNAFINEATASGRLPVEFTLLGYKPEPWSIVDSASVGKLMAYDLGGNYRAEVFRYQLRAMVGDELTREVMPTYPDDGITIMRSDAAGKQVGSAAPYLPPAGSGVDVSGLLATAIYPDENIGSNNWVVSGKLTQSGKPLLANDPHLGINLPAIWYQSHLVVTDEKDPLSVIGATFPGAPGVVIGHNDKVAWGVTNTGPDVQDLYIERRNPNNPYQFEFNGKWEDATVYKDPIKVKGQADIPFEVVVTRHGPIVSEVVGAEGDRPQEALALKWTAHLPSTEPEAILLLNRAGNWEEFREALKQFWVPTQNFVFASVDGTIAYRPGGVVPIRAKGDGLLPVPGWDGQHEWTGYIAFDKMPEVVNPAEEFIVTANNKVIDSGYPYLLSHTWAEPYRAARITEMIQGKTGLTADHMQALQTDYANLRARTMLPQLLPMLQSAELNATEKAALALLEQWNHVDSADQGAPFLFHLWWQELERHLYASKMGDDLYGRMTDKGNITDAMVQRALKGDESAWVKQAGGLQSLLVTSYHDAVQAAVDNQGKNVTSWEWGKYHRIGPVHAIGGAVAPLGWFLNAKALPVGGSNITVGAMSYNRETGMVTSLGVWRQVVDLGNVAGNSRDVVMPGQSGHFLSKWYTSQQDIHMKGQLHPQVFAADAYRGGAKLVLEP